VWKLQSFSVTQILREIKFGKSRVPKSTILAYLESLNFDFLKADSFKKVFFFQLIFQFFWRTVLFVKKKMEDELKKNTFLKESPFMLFLHFLKAKIYQINKIQRP